MMSYKRTLLYLVFLSFSWSDLTAQKKLDDVDSLFQFLKGDISIEDRVIATVELAEQYTYTNLDSALVYILRAEGLIPELSDSVWIANVYSVAATIHLHLKKYNKAMAYASKSLNVSIAHDYNMGAEMALDMKGSIMLELGKTDSAIYYYKQVFDYADSIGKAIAFNNLGSVYVQLGDVEKGADFYMKSVEFIDKSHPYADYYLASFYLNLGNLKNEQGEDQEAIGYIKLALQAAINTGNKKREALSYKKLGELLTNKNYFDSAGHYLYLSLILNIELKDEEAVDGVELALADLHLTAGRLDSAEYYLNRLATAPDGFSKVESQLSYKAVSAYLLIYKKNYKQAIKLLEELITMAKEAGNTSKLRTAYDLMFRAHENSNNFEGALLWHKKKVILADSFSNLAYKRHLSGLEEKYDTEKKESEIASLSQQTTIQALEIRQKNTGILIGIFMAIFIIVGGIYITNKRGALKVERAKMELITMELKEAQKRLALEKQYRESELKALKSQMNPHFIFNALNSIQEYIITNKKNEASNYLSQFADLIRTYLEHSDAGLISLAEEVSSLSMYLDLEVMRFEDTFDYSISVSESLNKDATHIPTMLIQPYVENAVKHGLLHKKGNKRLTISFEVFKAGSIQCIIEDNGVGREKTMELQKNRKWHKPFATKVTKERLDLLNFGKDKKIGIEVEDLVENNQAIGTRVLLTIPTKSE